MSEFHGHQEVRAGSDRSFGIVFAVAFAVLAAWPLKSGGEPRVWALAAAVAFLLPALLRPRLLRPLNLLWFRLGLVLGAAVAPVVMSLLFFLVVTPIGWIVRAMGKDLLRLKLDRNAASYWIERDDERNPMGTMKNQF